MLSTRRWIDDTSRKRVYERMANLTVEAVEAREHLCATFSLYDTIAPCGNSSHFEMLVGDEIVQMFQIYYRVIPPFFFDIRKRLLMY